MHIIPIHTDPILPKTQSLIDVVDQYVTTLSERSVVAITSKIVSLCEGAIVPREQTTKTDLAMQEADLHIDPAHNQYGIVITIKNKQLMLSAGVDGLNTNGYYVVLPKESQASAKQVWEYLKQKFHLSEVGVIITDSHTSPLRVGVTGIAIASYGFDATIDEGGRKDIFGEAMHVRINVADALAASSVFVMGETNEQTPLAVITDLPSLRFYETAHEIEQKTGSIDSLAEDVYHPLLLSLLWKSKK